MLSMSSLFVNTYPTELSTNSQSSNLNLTSNEANQAIGPIILLLSHAWLKLEHRNKMEKGYDEKYVLCYKRITNYPHLYVFGF